MPTSLPMIVDVPQRLISINIFQSCTNINEHTHTDYRDSIKIPTTVSSAKTSLLRNVIQSLKICIQINTIGNNHGYFLFFVEIKNIINVPSNHIVYLPYSFKSIVSIQCISYSEKE